MPHVHFIVFICQTLGSTNVALGLTSSCRTPGWHLFKSLFRFIFLLSLRWLSKDSSALRASSSPVFWDPVTPETFTLYSTILSKASTICSHPCPSWAGTSSALWTPWWTWTWTWTQTWLQMQVLCVWTDSKAGLVRVFFFFRFLNQMCAFASCCRWQRERGRDHHQTFRQRQDDLQRDPPQLSRLSQVPQRVSEMQRHPAPW